jgi:sugar lactone lactonase YvrE
MKHAVSAVFLGTAVLIATTHAVGARGSRPDAPQSAVSTYASSLNNPRGLTFGPDGNLYVAEGGSGGTDTTSTDDCDQVKVPIGPYRGGFTSRISKIDSNHVRTTVADGLPSSMTGDASGNLVSGVADVKFVGATLYAIEAGAGCSHGLLNTDNELLRVNSDGTTTPIVNLSAYQKLHPVARPEEDDFEPDGTWYSMVVVRGMIYAVEPNHGEIVQIDPSTGAITRVADVSASQGHIVPTTIAYAGNFLFGNLSTFPIVPGSSGLYKMTPSGQITKKYDDLTTVLGLVVGARDRIYVLESMTGPGFPGPGEIGTGQIVQIDPNGTKTVIAAGFSFPTAMTMGPDGALYVSNWGFAPAGLGEIVRVALQ